MYDNNGFITISDEVWLGCGERQGAKVCVINCGEEKLKLDIPLREVSKLYIPQYLKPENFRRP